MTSNLKRTILDKNVIRGKNAENLEKYSIAPYKTITTKSLAIECLGDLTNPDPKFEADLKKKNKSKEQHTATLFYKISKFPLFKHDHIDMTI